MRIIQLSVICSFLCLFFVFTSCKKDENKTLISHHGEKSSHHTGEDCMNCHSSGGSGEGIFTVAGSVYHENLSTPYANTTVNLYDDLTGSTSMMKTIEVDGNGNFYTTEPLDLSNGMRTTVFFENLTEHEMVSTITDGRCNKCHGISTDKIWVK